jgi:quercetin dioxygenase-like cupin family protein
MSTLTDTPAAVPLAEAAPYEPGTVVSRKLLKNASGSATLFAFAPGEAFREHVTPHEALIVVVDGEATVTFDGTTHRVREGESFRFPAGAPHAVEAATAMRMLLVVLRNDPPTPQ